MRMLTILVIAVGICIFVWPVISVLKAEQIQPIASAVSTLSGILFGFVMASISLIASAKDNTLIRNTTLTGYLPILVGELHSTMGWLLGVCLIFLVVLFLPDNLTYSFGGSEDIKVVRYSVALVELGVGLLVISFIKFFFSWRHFSKFSANM